MNALWYWELEPNKDYWIKQRDWMLYCASKPNPFLAQYDKMFSNEDFKVGQTLRIRLPNEPR